MMLFQQTLSKCSEWLINIENTNFLMIHWVKWCCSHNAAYHHKLTTMRIDLTTSWFTLLQTDMGQLLATSTIKITNKQNHNVIDYYYIKNNHDYNLD